MSFIETPANKSSISHRKLKYGVGINDADYVTNRKINGKRVVCPFYRTWGNMLARCYSPGVLKERPTYERCVVCEEWEIFSNFKPWMQAQDWEGKDLDKDLLNPGNEMYSTEFCLFVPQAINTLISTGRKNKKDSLPTGVYLTSSGRYEARYRFAGLSTYIGTYDTIPEAETAYKAKRFTYINEIAEDQPEPIKSALINYANVVYARSF